MTELQKQELQAIRTKMAKLESRIKALETEESTEYPIFCKSNERGTIVKFTGNNEGTVVYSPNDSPVKMNEYRDTWASHIEARVWKQIPSNGELWHGALVWVWDNYDTHRRQLRFYNVHTKTVCDYSGASINVYFDHYELYKGEWPEWAQEAFKTLDKGY